MYMLYDTVSKKIVAFGHLNKYNHKELVDSNNNMHVVLITDKLIKLSDNSYTICKLLYL